MIVFLDTEFTDLVVHPRLLSVGMVKSSGRTGEFYAEVTDSNRIQAAGRFARYAVTPQFGKVPDAACTYTELGARLCEYLDGLGDSISDGDSIELAYSYPLDWELVELAIRDSGRSLRNRRRIRPIDIYDVTGNGPGRLAADAYFKTQEAAEFSRHHALCDARALRLAYQAAMGNHVEAGVGVMLGTVA